VVTSLTHSFTHSLTHIHTHTHTRARARARARVHTHSPYHVMYLMSLISDVIHIHPSPRWHIVIQELVLYIYYLIIFKCILPY